MSARDRMRPVALGLCLGVGLGALAGPPVAAAASPWVSELAAWSARYHQDPPRLDTIRAGLEQAVIQSDSDVEDLIALAQVCFIWGDVRAATQTQKLEAYDRGRQAARRAVELAPRSAAAHFWFVTNTARWGQTNGVLRSLFLLPTVREEIRTVLALDPGFTPVYDLAGNVDYEVPGLFGGDLDRAESMFRKGLARDPRFTGMRVGLGKVLIRKGRVEEARRELEAVLGEREPGNLADWTLKDAPEARELLSSLPPPR